MINHSESGGMACLRSEANHVISKRAGTQTQRSCLLLVTLSVANDLPAGRTILGNDHREGRVSHLKSNQPVMFYDRVGKRTY